MTVQIQIPDVSGVPAGAWVAAAVVGWYTLAGLVVGAVYRRRKSYYHPEEPAVILVFSPFLFPMMAAVFAAQVFAWAVTWGVVPPPWKFNPFPI